MASTARTPETPGTTVVEPTTTSSKWLGAIGGGVLAGVAMGAVMALAMPEMLDETIPALYGQEGALVGVTAHLAHAAVFGLLFAAIVRFGNLSRYTDETPTSAALGLAYGVVLWVLAASVVMPTWLDAMNVAGAPAVPTFDTMSLLGHAVFGVVLGALYPYLKRY